MILCKWDNLPENLKTDAVKPYYDALSKKKFSLFLKRAFDLFTALVMFLLLLPLFLILSVLIKIDSKGPVFYRQKRVTQYGKVFGIFKFRTMVKDADKVGTHVTVDHDKRITRIGKVLRKLRLDEIPQLFNVIAGSMTFVGTRPEDIKYVEKYTDEMMATLLLPAGITSEASIYFKNEAEMLTASVDTEKTYIEEILPEKMYYNLKSVKRFGFFRDISIMFKTVFAVLGKNYTGDYEQSTKQREN